MTWKQITSSSFHQSCLILVTLSIAWALQITKNVWSKKWKIFKVISYCKQIKNMLFENDIHYCWQNIFIQGSTHTQHKDFKAFDFKGTIKGLIPGKTYIFRIQAETRIGYGPEAIWKEKMPILGMFKFSVHLKLSLSKFSPICKIIIKKLFLV